MSKVTIQLLDDIQDENDSKTTCLKRGCYWTGEKCAEPLLRVQIDNGLVLGIDTGSPFTVLAPGVGIVPLLSYFNVVCQTAAAAFAGGVRTIHSIQAPPVQHALQYHNCYVASSQYYM